MWLSQSKKVQCAELLSSQSLRPALLRRDLKALEASTQAEDRTWQNVPSLFRIYLLETDLAILPFCA